MAEPESDAYEEYRRHGALQAAVLREKAAGGGIVFEAYLPPQLASWILDKVASGVFANPSEAVFVILGEHHALEPHADLREELLRRSIQAAIDDPRPGIPAEEVEREMEQRLAAPRPEPAVWRGRRA
jgi:Arc/MetJ-type ribon-helix-helix transcriptional regulator